MRRRGRRGVVLSGVRGRAEKSDMILIVGGVECQACFFVGRMGGRDVDVLCFPRVRARSRKEAQGSPLVSRRMSRKLLWLSVWGVQMVFKWYIPVLECLD